VGRRLGRSLREPLVAAAFCLLVVPRLPAQELPAQEPSAQELPAPPRSYSVPKEQIPESFLGYLVGLIDADVQFSVDSERLLAVLPEFKGRKGDPFELMKEVARRQEPDRPTALSFRFPDDLVIPLPVGIFGYYPITVSVSRVIVLEERRFPSRIAGDIARGAELLSRDYEYRVSEGHARFHFDGWLVFVSGGFLEDFSVEGAAIFQDRGEWRALIAGRGRTHPVVCWLFDLMRTKLILSVPSPLLDVASGLAP
jgi:hypothetical protein